MFLVRRFLYTADTYFLCTLYRTPSIDQPSSQIRANENNTLSATFQLPCAHTAESIRILLAPSAFNAGADVASAVFSV